LRLYLFIPPPSYTHLTSDEDEDEEEEEGGREEAKEGGVISQKGWEKGEIAERFKSYKREPSHPTNKPV